MKKRILVISVISPNVEGRLARTLKLLTINNTVTLVSPGEFSGSYNRINYIQIGDQRPNGIIAQFAYLCKAIRVLNRQKNSYDLIYAANFFTAITAVLVKTNVNAKKLVYDAYEILFKSRKEHYGLKNLIYLLMEDCIVKHADLIIEGNMERALLFQGFYRTVECPITLSNFNVNENFDALQAKRPSNGQIKVCYFGFISKERRLFDVVKEIADTDNILFDIFGRGTDVDKLIEIIKSCDTDRIKYCGSYMQKEMFELLQNYDVGYINYSKNGYNNVYCEPNKIMEYATAGIPMVCYEHPKLTRLMLEFGLGVAADSIIDAIYKVYGNAGVLSNNCLSFANTQLKKRLEEERIFVERISEL